MKFFEGWFLYGLQNSALAFSDLCLSCPIFTIGNPLPRILGSYVAFDYHLKPSLFFKPVMITSFMSKSLKIAQHNLANKSDGVDGISL